MKKFKLVFVVALVAITVFAMSALLVGCSKPVKTVALLSDVPEESYGIAVKKGDSVTLDALNKVLNKFIEKDASGESMLDKSKQFHFDGNVSKKLPAIDLSGFAGNTKKVKLYTESTFPPYEYLGDSNTVEGIDVDIAYLLAQELKCQLVINDISFDSIPAAVQNSKADEHAIGAAGMTITEERKKALDFSMEYSTATQFIISFESNSFTKLEQLKGLTVACQESTTGSFALEDLKDAEGKSLLKKIESYKKTTDCYTALRSGKVDAIVLDKFPAQMLVKNDNKNK